MGGALKRPKNPDGTVTFALKPGTRKQWRAEWDRQSAQWKAKHPWTEDECCIRVDCKGYLTVRGGANRDKRLHTLVAEAIEGKEELPKDHDVHHENRKRMDIDPGNLKILTHKDHGAVSRRQAFHFRENDIKAEQEWNEYFDEARA